MTHPPATPQRRGVDRGPFRGLRAWWDRWGKLISGAWLVFISAALFVVAVQFYNSQAATNTAARVSCQRALEFAPRIADDYQSRGVFTAKQLGAYRRSIPKTCPSK